MQAHLQSYRVWLTILAFRVSDVLTCTSQDVAIFRAVLQNF